MTIVYRGILSGSYVYWTSLTSSIPGATNIVAVGGDDSMPQPLIDANTLVFYSFNNNRQDSGSLGKHLTTGSPVYRRIFGGGNNTKYVFCPDAVDARKMSVGSALTQLGSESWEFALFLYNLPTLGGTWYMPWGHYTAATHNTYLWIRADGSVQRFNFGYRDSANVQQDVSGTTAPPTGRWIHVVCVKEVNGNSLTGSIYQDGVLLNRKTHAGVSAGLNPTTTFYVGGNGTTSDTVSGMLGYLKLSNYAYSANDVLYAYSSSVLRWGM